MKYFHEYSHVETMRQIYLYTAWFNISILYKTRMTKMHEKKQMLFLSIKKWQTDFKNYRPISLLAISGKNFQRLMCNRLYEYFIVKELISPNQSDFRPRDPSINQILSVSHYLYQSFDNGFEVNGVFLGTSWAFDEVC